MAPGDGRCSTIRWRAPQVRPSWPATRAHVHTCSVQSDSRAAPLPSSPSRCVPVPSPPAAPQTQSRTELAELIQRVSRRAAAVRSGTPADRTAGHRSRVQGSATPPPSSSRPAGQSPPSHELAAACESAPRHIGSAVTEAMSRRGPHRPPDSLGSHRGRRDLWLTRAAPAADGAIRPYRQRDLCRRRSADTGELRRPWLPRHHRSEFLSKLRPVTRCVEHLRWTSPRELRCRVGLTPTPRW